MIPLSRVKHLTGGQEGSTRWLDLPSNSLSKFTYIIHNIHSYHIQHYEMNLRSVFFITALSCHFLMGSLFVNTRLEKLKHVQPSTHHPTN